MKNKNKQTKFPVARIKKIMQKDEEVGKVAQATPIVISKALELFLGLIVDESSRVTAARGSKKVEAYHLKHAVETTEMLDFLKEIVEAVPDPSAGGTVDLDGGEPDGGKKKRGKGKRTGAAGEAAPRRRRKKKGEGEDDVVPGDMDGEMKSEPEPEHEGDNAMEEDGDEEDGDLARGGYSGDAKFSAKSEVADWRDNAPYIPRR